MIGFWVVIAMVITAVIAVMVVIQKD